MGKAAWRLEACAGDAMTMAGCSSGQRDLTVNQPAHMPSEVRILHPPHGSDHSVHNIMTPLGDGAKFVIVKSSGLPGHMLMFVDGHGFSRTIAHSVITDPNAIDFEWLARAAAAYHEIPCERES